MNIFSFSFLACYPKNWAITDSEWWWDNFIITHITKHNERVSKRRGSWWHLFRLVRKRRRSQRGSQAWALKGRKACCAQGGCNKDAWWESFYSPATSPHEQTSSQAPATRRTRSSAFWGIPWRQSGAEIAEEQFVHKKLAQDLQQAGDPDYFLSYIREYQKR